MSVSPILDLFLVTFDTIFDETWSVCLKLGPFDFIKKIMEICEDCACEWILAY